MVCDPLEFFSLLVHIIHFLALNKELQLLLELCVIFSSKLLITNVSSNDIWLVFTHALDKSYANQSSTLCLIRY